MSKQRESLHEHRTKYREAGLVQVSAWIPAEHKARFLAECSQLREQHLAKLALQNGSELTHFDNTKVNA